MLLGYLLFQETTEQAVAFDHMSGGYPFMCHPRHAMLFKTEGDAIQWRDNNAKYIPEDLVVKGLKVE